MKTKFLICCFLLVTFFLFFQNVYSQQSDSTSRTSSLRKNVPIQKKSNSSLNKKSDCTNHEFSGQYKISRYQPFDESVCGFQNDDNIINFPDFGVTNVHSLDGCLDNTIPPVDARPHSEASIFIDPNDKFTIKVCDVQGAISPDGISCNDWFSSTDKGQTWSMGNFNNPNYNSYGGPSTVVDNQSVWYTCFQGYVMPDPLHDYYALTDIRVGKYSNSTWTGPFIVNSLIQSNPEYNYYTLKYPHMMIDNSKTSPYCGNLYCAYTPENRIVNEFGGNIFYPFCGDIEISKSKDQGADWENSFNDKVIYTEIFSPDSSFNIGANIQTGPSGEVYVVWAAYPVSSPYGQNNMPLEISGMTEKALVFTRSLDGGHSFGMVNPQFPFSYGTQIQSINGISSYRLAYGSWPFINASVNSFPSMCVDKSEGPNRGNIYVVWAEHAYDSINSHFLDEIDIYLIYSKDRGDSWSNRIRINTTPDEAENKHSFCPWICCDDETGTLSVIFYDDRDDDVLNGFVNAYVAMSRDYGLTWQNSRISDYNFTSSDPEYGSPFYFGIHNAISTKNALSYPVWTDSRLEVYGGEFYPVACQPELYTSPFYMWNCVDHYQNITEFVPSWKIREWEVSGYITAENTIDVNGLTVFNAGDSIVLLPSQDPTNPQGGFWSKNGSYLHAYIEGCQQFPQNSKSISLYDQDGYHQLGKSNKKVVSSENLIIFPNPCDGKFRVRLDNGSDLNCTIEIINSSGMSIYSGYFSNQSALNIDISSQPKGIYLIKVCTKDSTFVKKIVYQ